MPTERNCIKVDHALVGHKAQLLLEQLLIQVGGIGNPGRGPPYFAVQHNLLGI